MRVRVTVCAADPAANATRAGALRAACSLSTLGPWQGTPGFRAPTLSSTSAARGAGAPSRDCPPGCAEPTTWTTSCRSRRSPKRLGRVGERRLGLELISLDSIIGTVDRAREFDRDFRPTSPSVRERWQRINLAQRRGEAMPPIDVYRIGELHFVKDGHHRVSVAHALGYRDIEAYVTEVLTELGADRKIRMRDLPLKSHQRLFFERVPLPHEARERIHLSDEWRYAALAEAVEAWGFRASQARGQELSRQEAAEAWFRDEYEPVVGMLREAQLVPKGVSDTEAYMKVAHLRYLILRTHEWTDDVIDAIRRDLEHPGLEDDTMVRKLRRELK